MRKKEYLLISVLIFVVLSVLPFQYSSGQGDLTPPGAPAPTMHTLSEVYDEAAAAKDLRTPIYASDLPLTISTSGSYYFAENITFTTRDTHGIIITTNSVTIDLNGYAFTGPGNTAGTGGSGVYVPFSPGTLYAISIRNGTVRNWREYGIFSASYNSEYESLRCVDNGGSGLYIGQGCGVRKNLSSGNGINGISAGASCVLSGNICRANDSCGISGGRNCHLVNNDCTYNIKSGIKASYGTMQGNTCNYNDGNGIEAFRSVIKGNVCAMNKEDGILANNDSSFISDNLCYYNSGDGIEAQNKCRVSNNTSTYNGPEESDGAGIHVTGDDNCIENNVVTNNDRGIDVDGTGNLILRNVSRANTGSGTPSAQYDIAGGNDYAAIIFGGAGFVSSNPWANFSSSGL